MRKRIGLITLGIALNFIVASRFASQARINQPMPVTSTWSQQQILASHNLLKAIALREREDKNSYNTPFELSQVPLFIDGREEKQRHGTDASSRLDDHSLRKDFDSSVASALGGDLSTGERHAQTPSREIPETEDGERFRRVMQEARSQKLHDRPMTDIMQAIAHAFLGTAYKAGLLDESKEETLVVTLKQFDCVLFLETVLAIARGVAVQDYSYESFVDRIQDQRYREGQLNGYCSRLHYFSEWIFDNEKRGSVQDIGQALGGVPLNKKLNFMSTHRQSYPRLQDEATYQCIVGMEAKLNGATVDYVPTNQIRRVYPQLQAGDVIAIATNIPGLDVTHTGLVYRYPNGDIGFIHASPIGEVTIARDLQRYVSKVENAIGILIARPLDPRQTTVQPSY